MEPDTKDAVIDMMEEQKSISTKGGTMRLGAYLCQIKKATLAFKIYNKEVISERHRHRYEFNNSFLDIYEQNGMVASGRNPETNLVEIIEVANHPFFIGVQYHPELKSTVETPHPLFVAFVAAAKRFNERKTGVKNTVVQREMV